MTVDDAEEYTQALGQICAGSWRQIALARKLGVPRALGLSVEDWVTTRLGGYIKMSIPERREAVRDLTEEGHSAREIAEIVGVSPDTAARDVRNLTPKPDVPPVVDQERRRAEEDERHRRETIIRIMEEAYRCTMGLANEEFVMSIRERMLADADFCRTLKQRMRLDFGPLEDIAVGSQWLMVLVRQLEELLK
jgi:hypothetical protein